MDLIPGLPYFIGLECLLRVPFDQFPILASVCRRWKQEISSPEFLKLRKTTGFSEPVVVMVQAYPKFKKMLGSPSYRVTLCDLTTGTWSELPQVPWFRAGLPLFCHVLVVGFSLVVVGGQDPVTWRVSRQVSVYNLVSWEWTRGTDMPGCQRSFFACASDVDNNLVFVAGGVDEDNKALRSAMVYDVANDSWVSLPDMAMKRAECKGVFHGGKFHVIGGYDPEINAGRFGKSANLYSPLAGKWDPVVHEYLIAEKCPRTCFSDGDIKVYMCLNDDVAFNESNPFNWQALTRLPSQLRNVQITGGRNMLFAIGSTGYGGPHQAYVFNLRDRKWDNMEVPTEFTGHVQSCSFLNM